MADNKHTPASFLEDVASQIAYRPLRPAVMKELQDHIDDRISEYEEAGLNKAEAEEKAVADMGDPVLVGTEINAVRHVRSNPLLILFTAILMASGFIAAASINWAPNHNLKDPAAYFHGIIILVLTSLYAYPLLVRHWRRLLIASLMVFLVMACILSSGAASQYSDHVSNFYLAGYWVCVRLIYYTALLLGPLLTILLYYNKKSRPGPALLLVMAAGILIFWLWLPVFPSMTSVVAVYLISLTGTVLFMIWKKMFLSNRTVLIPMLMILAAFILLPEQQETFSAAVSPEDHIYDHWNDTYNSVLIQDLLSKTPVASGLDLSPDEMINYRTTSWYFTDAENSGVKRYFLQYYDETTVTLWDILPQHYHNNYLIALSIFLFGRLFGALVLAVIGGFFITMFRCVLKIRGQLAACVAFNCTLCLLTQTLLYIAGNFGHQYGAFTNIPLLSEGRISIVFNMLLLGFVISAYRYDKVVDEPVSYKIV